MSKSSHRIARCDPLLPSAGLFYSLEKAERPKLDVAFEYEGRTWRVRGPDCLGISEQSLLLVILELAYQQRSKTAGCPVVGFPNDGAGARLEDLFDCSPSALATISVSWSELARRCGRDEHGGSAIEQVRRELRRLCEVTIWAKEGHREYGSPLLRWQLGTLRGVDIQLSYRLTQAVLTKPYSPISLSERFLLQSDVARAVHFRWSVMLRPGGTLQFRIETLMGYVWANTPAGDSSKRRRTQALRKALLEISGLKGWRISTTDGQALLRAKGIQVQRLGTTSADGRRSVRNPPVPAPAPVGEKPRQSGEPPDVSSLFASLL
jgi:hypothetical protein